MDIALLLLLPVIGGYAFSHNLIFSRYHVARRTGYPLYLSTLFYAVFCFIAAFLIYMWLLNVPAANDVLQSQFNEQLFRFLFKPGQVKLSFELLQISAIAFFIGIVGWAPINLATLLAWLLLIVIDGRIKPKKPRSLTWTMTLALPPTLWGSIEDDDELAALFLISSVTKKALSITLDNQKVYIGLLINPPDPRQIRKAVTLLPLISGYRDKNSGVLLLTTQYTQVYRQLDSNSDGSVVDLFRMVIPIHRICSASLFDIVLYQKFHQEQPNTGTMDTVRESKPPTTKRRPRHAKSN